MTNGSKKTAVMDRPKVKSIQFIEPSEDDGAKMWELVRETSILDENSAYSYLMMSKFFKDTCLVAKQGEELVGFITAFKPPEKPHTLFVWQIGVSKDHRGKGIATRMLEELLKRDACQDVDYLEATISPSNKASEALFTGYAKKTGSACQMSMCFPEEAFPEEGDHEAERTFRIGPLK